MPAEEAEEREHQRLLEQRVDTATSARLDADPAIGGVRREPGEQVGIEGAAARADQRGGGVVARRERLVDRAVAASRTGAIAFEDLVATLTEFTARTIVEALPSGDDTPATLICSGGGTLNPVLLARLAALGAEHGIAVESSADRGIDPAFKESLMFAFLGYCSWHGVPFALARDAPARVLGRLSAGPAPLRLPEPLAAGTSVVIERSERGGQHIERVERVARIETGGGAP